MEAGTIIALFIMSIVAAIMEIIGICQMVKKDGPVGFYNTVAPPKKEEITDIIAWNKKHGIMWLLYGVCIELGFILSLVVPSGALEVILSIGGVIIPLPFMVLGHKRLEREYRKK